MEINSNPTKIANYLVQYRRNGRFAKPQFATAFYYKIIPNGKKWYAIPIPPSPRKGRAALVREVVKATLAYVDAERRSKAAKRKAKKAAQKIIAEDFEEDLEEPTRALQRASKSRKTGVISSKKFFGKTWVFEGIEYEYTTPLGINSKNSEDFMQHFRENILRDILEAIYALGIRRGQQCRLRLNGSGDYLRIKDDGSKKRDRFGISTDNRIFTGEEELLEDIYERTEKALVSGKSYLTRMSGSHLYFHGFYLEKYS